VKECASTSALLFFRMLWDPHISGLWMSCFESNTCASRIDDIDDRLPDPESHFSKRGDTLH